MPGRQQPPEYFRARSALNVHLYRHHDRFCAEGMLQDRLDQHDELHVVAIRLGIDLGHTHEPCEDETDIELAFRLLREGEQQYGEADSAGDA